MRQLTSLDAQFLALETTRQTGHVGGLAILDPSTAPDGRFDCTSVQQLIADRLPLLPPLRWRLAEVPFDLDFHVRELALPSPGDDDQLAEQVARIMSRPLDRARPLWELYVVHGLKDGYVGMFTKIHHAVIDGMSGAEIMGLLLDLTPEGRELPEPGQWGADERPTELQMLAKGVGRLPLYPLRVLRAIPSTLPNVAEAPAIFGGIPGAGIVGDIARRLQSAIGDERLPDSFKLAAPKVAFSGRISPHRRFVFGKLELEDVKTVKNLHGSTVNDVIVSICAGAVRRWLLAHDDLPDEPLVAQIPVSVRGQDEIGTYGNKIMLMSAPLFTDVADPVERLARTHEALAEMKDRHRALPAQLLQDANNFIPPAVFSRAARLTFRLSTSGRGRPPWNLVISNVPGPQFPLYCAGARLVANYPVSVITDGMGLNITVMSYCGKLDFGIVADRDQMPDAKTLIEYLRAELDLLMPKTPKKASANGRSNGKAKASANGKAKHRPKLDSRPVRAG